jgi:hypothetical protein
MWPLLKRDGQGLNYAVLTLLWNYAIGYDPSALPNSLVKILSLVGYFFLTLPTSCTDGYAGHLRDYNATARTRSRLPRSSTLPRPLPSPKCPPIRLCVWRSVGRSRRDHDVQICLGRWRIRLFVSRDRGYQLVQASTAVSHDAAITCFRRITEATEGFTGRGRGREVAAGTEPLSDVP